MQHVACIVINPPFLKQCHFLVSLNKSMSECKQVSMVGTQWHLAHSVLNICTDAQYLLVVTCHIGAASCIYVTHNTFHLHAFYNVGWLRCGRKQLCSTVTFYCCGCVKALRKVTQTKLSVCVWYVLLNRHNAKESSCQWQWHISSTKDSESCTIISFSIWPSQTAHKWVHGVLWENNSP